MASLRKTIRQRREGSEHHDDFLQSLLTMSNQSSSDDQLTDSQIVDNILTLIIAGKVRQTKWKVLIFEIFGAELGMKIVCCDAGQITTASAIAWMVKYLDENPDVQERVRVRRKTNSPIRHLLNLFVAPQEAHHPPFCTGTALTIIGQRCSQREQPQP